MKAGIEMSTINIFQISLEIWGCIICVIFAMISGDKAYKEGGALSRLWFMLLVNGVLLISDAFAYIFRGEVSTLGMYMTRISNFMVFALEGIMTWNIAACVQCLIQDDERVKVLEDRWMRVCGIMIMIQLLGIAVTPFTRFYFYFDETNHYHRGVGIILTFLMLGSVCAISGVKLFLHRKKVPTNIIHTFRTAILIFGVCFVVQFLKYGISLINISLTIILLMLYLILWKDSLRREMEKQTNEVEKMIQEIMTERKE